MKKVMFFLFVVTLFQASFLQSVRAEEKFKATSFQEVTDNEIKAGMRLFYRYLEESVTACQTANEMILPTHEWVGVCQLQYTSEQKTLALQKAIDSIEFFMRYSSLLYDIVNARSETAHAEWEKCGKCDQNEAIKFMAIMEIIILIEDVMDKQLILLKQEEFRNYLPLETKE